MNTRPQLVFLLYANRSGSTFLAASLAETRHVGVTIESTFFARLVEVERSICSDTDFDAVVRLLMASIRTGYGRCFRRYRGRRMSKQSVGHSSGCGSTAPSLSTSRLKATGCIFTCRGFEGCFHRPSSSTSFATHAPSTTPRAVALFPAWTCRWPTIR
jgi:hypothetical protein